MITLNYQGLDGTQLHLFCREESVAVLAAIIQQGRYMHQDPLLYAVYMTHMSIKGPKGSIEVPLFPEVKDVRLISNACATNRWHLPLSSLFDAYLSHLDLQDAINAIPTAMDADCQYRIEVIDQNTQFLPYTVCRDTFYD